MMMEVLKKGMHARVVDKKDAMFNRIGEVVNVTTDPEFEFEIVELRIGKNNFKYKIDANLEEVFPLIAILSRSYAIQELYELRDNHKYEEMTNEELLEEICLSGIIHDECISYVADDRFLKLTC